MTARSIFLIYNEHYGFQAREGFSFTKDFNKGKKIHDKLVEEGLVAKNSFVDPGMTTLEELSEVHTPEYIQSLNEDPSKFFTLSGLEFLAGVEGEERKCSLNDAPGLTNISIDLSPQIPVDKVAWFQDGYSFKLGKVQEVFIPSDNACCFPRKGTLEEFIIRGVSLYHRGKRGRENNFRVNRQKIDQRA